MAILRTFFTISSSMLTVIFVSVPDRKSECDTF